MICVIILSVFVFFGSITARDGNPSATKRDVSDQQAFSMNLLLFALKLTNELYTGDGTENVLISPISIYSSLGVVNLAASEQTRAEISKLMGVSKDDDKVVRLNEITINMTSFLELSHRANISVVNGIFLQKSFQLKQQFIEQINGFHGCEIANVDFTSKEPAATEYINNFISKKTNDRIPKLFEKSLPDDTKLALVNSIFFSAQWANQFNNQSTTIEKFNTGIEEIDVQMMANKQKLYYIDYPEGSFEAIALPYENEESFMYIALPYANQTLKNVVEYLNSVGPLFAISKTVKRDVEYKIPKMKFSKILSLKEQLIKLGVSRAFENADFSNMVSAKDLVISDLVHGAEIEVNEKGTSASGATAEIFNIYSSPIPDQEPAVQFYLNRPFLFFINSVHAYYSTLFSGIVHNPGQA